MQALLAAALGCVTLFGANQTHAAGQTDSAIGLRAVRFFRSDQGTTRVKAFVQIPYALMTAAPAAGAGPDGILSYEVAVAISDSTGLTLHTDAWRNRADGMLARTRAAGMEILEFPVRAGKFRLEVTITDSVSGRRYAAGTDIEGFADAPVTSDLLLSPRIRAATPGDTVPQAGELAFGSRGDILVTATPVLELTPLRAMAHYLLEVYSEEATSGSLAVSIRGQDGQVLVRTPPTPVNVGAGGQVLTGQLDLTGLPPGSYDLVLVAAVNGQEIERVVPFTMAELQSTLEAEVARRESERDSDEGYFAAMSDAELAEAREPLDYIAEQGDRLGNFDDLMSTEARRRFLTEFWQRRDPDPATPRNEYRDQFYAAVAYANEHYSERGRAGRSGWRTDRGRVFARHGAPSEVLDRVSSGRAPPYQVWRYTRGRPTYYVFVDRTRLEAYNMVCSNDVKETCRNDWREIVGEDAVRDIGQFLGVDFYQRSGANPIDF